MSRYPLLLAAATAFLLTATSGASFATSGPGCLYVVNVAPYDVLNMRARPSARSAIVDQLPPRRHGIIHLDAKCIPLNRPWGSRWCPVTHYESDRVTKGYVKARYVRDSDCP
ncbi:hypothetical protein [Notoacmeibacter ruber]|uniref:hypothetical protein n=1 Tax=Notoacmeibacter ruber TaxID=2670375 RepID=UPI0011C438CC|nr:hypothetical protein [Notoacmeibacter ruber]